MGLASYGEDAYPELMRELMTLTQDGWFRLKRDAFGMHGGGASGASQGDGRLRTGQLWSSPIAPRSAPPAARRDMTAREAYCPVGTGALR